MRHELHFAEYMHRVWEAVKLFEKHYLCRAHAHFENVRKIHQA